MFSGEVRAIKIPRMHDRLDLFGRKSWANIELSGKSSDRLSALLSDGWFTYRLRFPEEETTDRLTVMTLDALAPNGSSWPDGSFALTLEPVGPISWSDEAA